MWASDDRGNSWTAISGDLTTDVNRYELEFMGRVWSVDDLIDNGAMSKYATLTGISESPVEAGVIYTGSDDGLIHVTEDAGATWRRAADLPGVPERAFINDIEASQHAAATVFAVADNHKEGDFRPLLFRSDDAGRTWNSIAGDLPDGTILWAIEQDHLNPNLLFLGAEFGMYVSVNGGANWHMLPGPTISHRDLEVQRRDNDVVGATFGRGFYVLDDYTPLRELAGAGDAAVAASEGGALFPVRDAWWYIPSVPMQARGKPTLGTDDYTAPNPDFGAVISYYLPETPTTAAEARRAAEGEVRSAGGDVPFPGYDALNEESTESSPRALVAIADADGRTVRWVPGPARQGLHRVSWDLRAPAPDPIDLTVPGFTPPWVGPPQGPLAAPGDYSAQLVVVTAEGAREVGSAQTFEVRPVPTAEPGTDFGAVVAFQNEASELRRRIASAGEEVGRARDRLRHMRAALLEAPDAPLDTVRRPRRARREPPGLLDPSLRRPRPAAPQRVDRTLDLEPRGTGDQRPLGHAPDADGDAPPQPGDRRDGLRLVAVGVPKLHGRRLRRRRERARGGRSPLDPRPPPPRHLKCRARPGRPGASQSQVSGRWRGRPCGGPTLRPSRGRAS